MGYSHEVCRSEQINCISSWCSINIGIRLLVFHVLYVLVFLNEKETII